MAIEELYTRKAMEEYAANLALAIEPINNGQPLETRKLPRVVGGERHAETQGMRADYHIQ